MIVVTGGIKGGGGKTTLATNLAVMRALDKRKVLLIDADEQRSASDWAGQREVTLNGSNISDVKFPTISLIGKSVYQQVQKLLPDYQDIIIDTGGRDTTSQRSALTIANIFLIPFKPRSFDIWTLAAVKCLVNEIRSVNPNLKCLIVINQADPKGQDNIEAIKLMKEHPEFECIDTTIGSRKIFSNAAADGLAVCECEKDGKSIDELTKLYSTIYVKNI